jgi:hypothetical protein
VNNNLAPAANIKPEWRVDPVTAESFVDVENEVTIVERDVVNDNNALRHDSDKLTAALLEIARHPRSETRVAVIERELVPAGAG